LIRLCCGLFYAQDSKLTSLFVKFIEKTKLTGFAGGELSDLADIDGLNQAAMLAEADGRSTRQELLYDIANFENTNFTFFVSPAGFPADFELGGAFGAAIR
jgi:hypothetical protein